MKSMNFDSIIQKKFEQIYDPKTTAKIYFNDKISDFFEYTIDLSLYDKLEYIHIFADNAKNINFINYNDNIKAVQLFNVHMDLTQLPKNLKILKSMEQNYTDKDFVNLPNELEILHCDSNNIYKLDNLPSRLKKIDCSKNNIVTLDNLPETLEYLCCSFNKLIKLDDLPIGLTYLNCEHNEIITLNSLPDTLIVVLAKSNHIQVIDKLPKALRKANFTSNPLISSPKCQNSLILLNYSLDAEKANTIDKIENATYKLMYGGYHTLKYATYGLAITGIGITCLIAYPFAYAYSKLN